MAEVEGAIDVDVEGQRKAWLSAGYDLVRVWRGDIAFVVDIIPASIGKES